MFDDDVAGLIVGMRDAVGLAGADVGQVAREEQQPRPIEADLKAAGPSGKLEQIDATPDEPGEKTGKVEAEQIRNGGMAANGTELAELLEEERFGDTMLVPSVKVHPE